MAFGSPFYGPGAVHEGRDIVQMKVRSDRRGEGGGISWRDPPSSKRMCLINKEETVYA